MFPKAKVYGAHELRVGLSAEFERDITEADVFAFASNSGDANPLHVDNEYAGTTAYGGRLVHGAFQVGLASAMIGMHLPGRQVLLASVSARFPAPLFFPCKVRVLGEVTSWHPLTRAGQLRVTVLENSQHVPTAEIVLGFTLHEGAETKAEGPLGDVRESRGDGRRVVLISGASGGVGAELVEALSGTFDIVAMTRQKPLAEALLRLPGIQEWRGDLDDATRLREGLATALHGRPLYGVVHAAWPGAPLGGLLQAQDEVVENQLLFGATTTLRLARCLFEFAPSSGGRFVAISSIAGSQKPVITLSAYSLGKAALEGTVRLLAPELARRNITINAVSPAFIATGMNKHKSEQQRKIEASRVPLGRLCEPSDVAALVGYLLSNEASFVSGQIVGLTGGQL